MPQKGKGKSVLQKARENALWVNRSLEIVTCLINLKMGRNRSDSVCFNQVGRSIDKDGSPEQEWRNLSCVVRSIIAVMLSH